jgi:Raf kinase inhibitor-like YbhB/YbcL family protein
MAMTLTSPAFAQGETIPTAHSCDGQDLSPAFAWTGVPAGAVSLMLLCDDPDAPNGTFRHWAAYNIPADWTGLKAGYGAAPAEPEIRQAVNDFNKPGYGGPCPPKGDKPHAYHFRLVALSDWIVSAAHAARCLEIQQLARPLEIEAVELVGFYGR